MIKSMILTDNCKDMMLEISHLLFYLIFIKTQGIKCYFFHFTDEETKTLQGNLTCVVLHSKMYNWNLNPGHMISYFKTFPWSLNGNK